jgi:hypothetical protein
MFRKKSKSIEEFKKYKSLMESILVALENDLNLLQEADTQIASELMYAEKNDNPIKLIGESRLGEFQRFYEKIKVSRDRMTSFVTPLPLQQFQEMYVAALNTLLESVSYRVKTCEYIINDDGENAEKALLRVQPITNEFKSKESNALKELERGLSKYRRY